MDAREETFAALHALAAIADRSEAQGWSKLALALRKAVEVVEERLRSSELTVVVAGGPSKRTLYNVLGGEPLFDPDGKDCEATLLTLRRAQRFGYVARMEDGRIEDFARKHPDRSAWFATEIAKAEKELDAARLRITTIDVELTAKEETLSERQLLAAERMRADASLAERARALYATIVSWLFAMLRLRSPPQLAAPPSRRSPGGARVVSAMIARRDVERTMEDARGALAKREKDVERVRAEAARHDAERKTSFISDVRALTDGAQRGAEIAELTIELASGLLPEEIVIADGPVRLHLRELRDRAGACFILDAPGSAAVAETAEAVRPIVPHVLDAREQDLRVVLPALFERIRAEAGLSVLALALADMPARMRALTSAVAAGEAEQRTRIDALERDRLPEPGKFREDQLAQMTGAIDEGARRVLKRAQVRLKERAGELEREWVSALESCTDRSALTAAIERIDASTSERLNQLLDGVGEDIGTEMHATSELLQVWVLEEVRRRYRTRYLRDTTAAVIAEVPADEILALRSPPLSRLLRATTRRRMAIAFGSIATGASIGGAVQATTGAAIGAAAGLLAGLVAILLPRLEATKRECITAIRTRLAGVEKGIAAWLDASYGNFARDIRAAIDDALVGALERRDQSILRLIDLEGKSLERERQKLHGLEELKAALDEHATKFSHLAATADAALREYVSATR